MITFVKTTPKLHVLMKLDGTLILIIQVRKTLYYFFCPSLVWFRDTISNPKNPFPSVTLRALTGRPSSSVVPLFHISPMINSLFVISISLNLEEKFNVEMK